MSPYNALGEDALLVKRDKLAKSFRGKSPGEADIRRAIVRSLTDLR